MRFSDLVFDRCCRLCNAQIDEGAVCSSCDNQIMNLTKIRTKTLDVSGREVEAKYLFDYNNEIIKKLLFALKRISDRELAEYASILYRKLVPKEFSGTLTNCPRRGISIRNYGFDQVAVPCKILCKQSGGRLKYERVLKRRGFTKEQKYLDSEARKRNISGKFRVKIKDIPQNILIVDDVVTTGSTAKECAAEILKFKPDANISFVFLASRNRFSGK